MKTNVLTACVAVVVLACSLAIAQTPPLMLAEPELADDLNSHSRNLLRYMSPDGLTAYVLHTNVTGGNWETFSQTRPDTTSPFDQPQTFPFDNVGYKPSVVASTDGLTLYCSATDTVSEYTRLSVTDEFDNARVLSSLSDGFWNVGPACISSDGLRLYLSMSTTSASGKEDIAVATRSSVDEDFGTPSFMVFDALNTEDYVDARPILSPDELEVVFTSNRPGLGEGDLYYARRSSISEPFGEPLALDALNTDGGEVPCAWANDTLYFARVTADQTSCSVYTVAVPEPATMSLLALGGVALLNRRNK